MSGVNNYTTEQDWSKGLDSSKTLTALRRFVATWKPYVPDAAAVVKAMNAASFAAWRDGLESERKGIWAGETHTEAFGALLLPTNLMTASEAARHYKVPMGCALIRLHNLKRDQSR